MTAFLAEDFFSFGLVHRDEPRRPAIGKALSVQLIENARQGRGRKPQDGQRAQVCLTNHRLKAACERLICEDRVEKDRKFRCYDRVTLGRDGRVKVGQRLVISQWPDFIETCIEKIPYTVRLLLERLHTMTPGRGIFGLRALDQGLLGAACCISWR